jgi:hypothetical protein
MPRIGTKYTQKKWTDLLTVDVAVFVAAIAGGIGDTIFWRCHFNPQMHFDLMEKSNLFYFFTLKLLFGNVCFVLVFNKFFSALVASLRTK